MAIRYFKSDFCGTQCNFSYGYSFILTVHRDTVSKRSVSKLTDFGISSIMKNGKRNFFSEKNTKDSYGCISSEWKSM